MRLLASSSALALCLLLVGPALAEGQRIDLLAKPLSIELVGGGAAQQEKIYQKLLLDMPLFERLVLEINQLNSRGVIENPSSYLVELLQLCDSWEKNTRQAFSCRIGGLQRDWQVAQEKGELPDRSAMRKKARLFLQQGWLSSPDRIAFSDAAKTAGFNLDIEGLLQGFVLDKIVERLLDLAAKQNIILTGMQVNFSGQQRCWGKPAATNGCAANALSGRFLISPLARVNAAAQALAILDQSQGLQKIGSYSLSKILTPKEGWPIEFAPSAMVMAKDAATAAVIARSLVTMPIAAGIDWVNSQAGVEALLMTEKGTVFPSKGWYSLLIPDAEHQPLWSGEKQFLIEYQTLDHQIAEYRRPYAAIWISDRERLMVRQLVVHGDNLRWLKNIPLWWRRYGSSDELAVDGLARATTAPGQHMLVWDGRDDKGNKVPKGNYLLHIEAAREHGEHELVSLAFELNGQAFDVRASGEKELGVIKVSFAQQP